MANEKRLIDRNEIFPNGTFFANAEDPLKSLDELIKRIWSIPTVDAVEVVHGRWLNWKGEPIMPDDYWRLWRCSVCKNEWEYPEAVDADEVSFHYCPNCGAKMDGDGNGTLD